MKRLICWLFGHRVDQGPLQRSPNTVYTHWRDLYCSRCGERHEGRILEYHDAITEPELFRLHGQLGMEK